MKMLMKLQEVVLKHKSAQDFILNGVVWCVHIENGDVFQHHVTGALWFDSEMMMSLYSVYWSVCFGRWQTYTLLNI
jgi:hypothetical protein